MCDGEKETLCVLAKQNVNAKFKRSIQEKDSDGAKLTLVANIKIYDPIIDKYLG